MAGRQPQLLLQRRREQRPGGLRAVAGALLAAAALAAACTAFVSGGPALRSGRRPSRCARKGWGDDVKFLDATIASNVEAGEGLRLIQIEVPPTVFDAFKRPGQFVQAKAQPDAKPSFYAIASAPGKNGPLEFLIKQAENNAWLTGLSRGDVAQLSEAQGKGFDLACEAWTAAEVSQIGLFATGTGIAPLRSAIESGAFRGKATRLYIGSRTEGALGFADSFQAWRKDGVEVVPVLSKPAGTWSGRTGYIQDALKADEERGEGFVLPSRHGALLCGQKEMVAAVRSVLAEVGVPQERTLLNF